ncbi:NAD-dependent epimerase/dehydratase family protein [Modestobacter sp. SYSU DS0657]
MLTALVTGAAGFIGSRLAANILQTRPGWQVVGVDNFSDYYDTGLKKARIASLANNPNFVFHDLDLGSATLPNSFTETTTVFHLAGQPGVRSSWGSNFSGYLNDNVLATQRLLEAATTWGGLNAFVYASSSSVYGEATSYPTTEDQTTRPVSPYGVTKLAGENITMLYGKTRGLPVVSLRFHTVYGPGQRPDMAIHRLINSAISGDIFELYGARNFVRDFTYVDDIVAGCIAAADSPDALGHVINLAGGSSVSMQELVDLIGKVAGMPVNLVDRQPVAGDVRVTGGSIKKANRLLGWFPTVKLAEGIEAQYQDLLDR